LVLLGYALFGKGFAYLGFPPVYLGEVVMLWGLLTALVYGRWHGLFDSLPIHILLALAIWSGVRTVPYLSTYRVDALRDAALWGYGAIAIVVFVCLTAEPARLGLLLRRYQYLCWLFLFIGPLTFRLSRMEVIPDWPWSDTPMIAQKGGDMLVHLAGVLAFWVAGFGGHGRSWKLWLLAGCIAMVGAYNRGGLLTLLSVVALCMLLRPLDRTVWRLVAVSVGALALLATTGIRINIPSKDRDISYEQLVHNLQSVTSDSNDSRLNNTKVWRLRWWRDIYDYTIRGQYFWTGKGFGVNLADDDGYQGTQWEGKLRSPHNGHLTILARAGVPGFVLWVLLQLSWGGSMCLAYFRAHIRGDDRWSGLYLFLLAYWLAFMANASFDVFIEGPMGGIWFWTVFGVGLAALSIERNFPETLDSFPDCRRQTA
jgi:hypothetical protein